MGVILEKTVGKMKNRLSKVLEQILCTRDWYYNYKLSLGCVQKSLGYIQVSLQYARVSSKDMYNYGSGGGMGGQHSKEGYI